DSLARLLRFLGHTVIADNHLGDWGTQFGMLLYGYKHFRDDAAFQADPVRELTRRYLHMRELTKGAEEEENKPADPAAKQYADALAEETNGAIGIFPVPRKEDSVPALVRKRDGAFTYMTSDLATIRYRVNEWHPGAMLYVVDARQAFHFKQLFDAARRWGYDRVELEHVAFGSVLAPGRTPTTPR